MIINHNLNAMNAHRNIGNLVVSQGKSMEKLNSGLRISRASDDAAGLVISEKMRSQIRGLKQASRNGQDGISMIQTAEGALSETHSLLQRMRELALQSSNGTYNDEDRKAIDTEFQSLKKEMDRIANDTEFNGITVLNGRLSGNKYESTNFNDDGAMGTAMNVFEERNKNELNKLGEGKFSLEVKIDGNSVNLRLIDRATFNPKTYEVDRARIDDYNKNCTVRLYGAVINFRPDDFNNFGNGYTVSFDNTKEKVGEGTEFQIGANQNQLIGLSIDSMRSREIGLGGLVLTSFEDSQEVLEYVDKAVTKVSEQRSSLGAIQNRLEHAITSTNNTAENLQAAESRIRDVDMAKEMMNLTKFNVLQQASQAMISQANQAPQQVMSILK